MDNVFTPPQLVQLFAQSAQDEGLPGPQRAFAARLTILAGHVARIDKNVNAAMAVVSDEIQKRTALKAELEGHIAELAAAVQAVHGIAVSAPTAAPSADTSPAAAVQPRNTPEGDNDDNNDDDEETATQAMVEQVMAETAAEAAAPPTSVTPLRKPSGKKQAQNNGSAA